MKKNRTISLTKHKDSYGITFNAMASPCEIIIQSTNQTLAQELSHIITTEVWRIEDKYSRYDPSSLCSTINSKAGQSVNIDDETYLLLNFADQCYKLSDGLFDITSGALRSVWSFQGKSEEFDEGNHAPSQSAVDKVLANIGWNNVSFDNKHITLANNMELDFGGICKEYAVDRAIILAKQLSSTPVLVNLGGDLAVTGPRLNNNTWQVAIERPDVDTTHENDKSADMIISLKSGALATSGDTKRFLIHNGIRYGHILNAKTGWPITKAPRSITVVAPQCIQAGILATLALLQGNKAECFLSDQDIKFWARR